MNGPLETVDHSKARVRGGRLVGPIRTGHSDRLAVVVGHEYTGR